MQTPPRSVRFSCVLSALLITCAANGGESDDETSPVLTIDRIYKAREFDAKSFSSQWLPDGSGYTTLEESDADSGGRDIVRHDTETGEKSILVAADQLVPPGESTPLGIDGYRFSEDLSQLLVYTDAQRVWRKKSRGDYWLLDRSSRELRKIGGDAAPSTLMSAKLSPDAKHVAYVRDRNIYVESVRDHTVRQLTQTASSDIINGAFDWVYEEEFQMQDGFRWSPDGSRIAYWQLDTSGVREVTLINNTDGLYPRSTKIKYPKTGQQNSACRIGAVHITDGKTVWFQVPGDPRENYLPRMQWTEDSQNVVVQQLNRLQNRMTVMIADASIGQFTSTFQESDEAWVDVHDEMFWLANNSQFTWISERDGWRHVYLVSRDEGQLNLATPGNFDVIRLLHVDEDDQWLYFLASPDNPTQQYLFRVHFDGSDLQRITPDGTPGTHSYDVAPGSRWAIHTYSNFDTPPVTDLIQLNNHHTVRTLETNKSLRKKLDKLSRVPSEFFRVDIGDEVWLDAWCIKPPQLDENIRHPLLVYVYGEPAGRTVGNRWDGSRYLWHLMLAQQGYVVMSFDNRGARVPRGRAWRKSVYRQIGILAPRDQAAAVRAVLKERAYLDPDRVGIWGWSGGGSMSLNAIFKFPDLYQTAIAIAPVANQRMYDTIYQERYMGLPRDNVDGYTQGSPVTHAHQLQGNLLIIHGTGDDNCHYQATETLINELIRHNKLFTMLAYPNRTHSIREGKNTTRHLRQVMTHYLHEKLPTAD